MFQKSILLSLSICLPLYAYTETNIGTDFKVFHQPGHQFTNQGYASEVTGEQVFSTGFTLNEQVGYEHFLGDHGDHHGLRSQISAMYPASKTIEVNATAGYRTLGRSSGDFELETHFNAKEEALEWDLSFQRAFVMDSYFSYAGLGNARLHQFQGDLVWNQDVLRYRINPNVGWVTAGNSPSNFKGGLKGSAELLMIQEEEFDLDLIYQIGFIHYQLDQSGTEVSNVEPYPGGYFSPRLYVEQVPHIAAKYRPSNDAELSLTLGPSLQYVREFQKETSFAVGALSQFALDYRMNKWASLKTQIGYQSLANHFGRFQSSLSLSYLL